MKKFLWAYIANFILLLVVFAFHYVDLLQDVLGERSSDLIWKFEVMAIAFWRPVFALLTMQTLLIFIGYLGIYGIFKKMKLNNSNSLLLSLLAFAVLIAALILGLFEPILATDYFEYGVRQELNHAFEFIGYTRINVTVYIYLALTAAITWFFVKNQLDTINKKTTPVVADSDLLDD